VREDSQQAVAAKGVASSMAGAERCLALPLAVFDRRAHAVIGESTYQASRDRGHCQVRVRLPVPPARAAFAEAGQRNAPSRWRPRPASRLTLAEATATRRAINLGRSVLGASGNLRERWARAQVGAKPLARKERTISQPSRYGAAPDPAYPELPSARSRHSAKMRSVRKDVREFIRRLEAVGLEVEATPGHYRVLRDGKPLRKANGMPFMLPFSPDTIRWRRSAIVELRKLGIDI
jgi:hypothetical protein